MTAILDPLVGETEMDGTWSLRLYIAGRSPKSLSAVANLQRLCAAHLAGRHEIEIIDLVEFPAKALTDNILAVPTLVRRSPAPCRKVIGDLSNEARSLAALELHADGQR